jgi:hypothetical protein
MTPAQLTTLAESVRRTNTCYCGQPATVRVPSAANWSDRVICQSCHELEQKGVQEFAAVRERARAPVIRHWCVVCDTAPQQTGGLCRFCMGKPRPTNDVERVDRRIAVQRLVAAEMRVRR